MPAAPADAPVMLFAGDDDLAIKQKARLFFDQWCSASGGFDHERISGNAANSSEALAALGRLRESLQTLPFFGAKVIWFQNCNFLGTDRTSESAAVSESVADLAQTLKDFRWQGVRLIISAGQVDKRKAFYKTLAKIGVVEEHNGWSIDDRDWGERAEAAAASQIEAAGKEIEPRALALLAVNAGVNNRHLANEIDKLCLYLGERGRITAADVENIVSRNQQSRAFALADALGQRDLPKLLRTLEDELRDMKSNSKKSEIGLLYGLITKVRSMLMAKELARQKWITDSASYSQLQGQLREIPAEAMPGDKRFNPLSIHPFVLHTSLQQSRKYSTAELVAAMEILLEANLSLVSRGLDEALVLQQALVRIAQTGPTGGAVQTK